jgi:hypothetical protein
MTTRWVVQFAFNSLLTFAFIALLNSPQRAQAQDDIENAKFQATGAVNSNSVYIRSGASENDYATMKLDKGAQVTVVGERFNWLKILPPDGSFCYVSKAYVNRAGNGSIGMVTGHVFIRIGSALNSLKTKTGPTLEPNQRVEIIGEQDEYFKVKPTDDIYLYVNKQFVDFVGINDPSKKNAIPTAPPVAQQDEKPSADNAAAQEVMITHNGDAPATQPTTQPEGPVAAAEPTTQPVVDAGAEFDKLEQTYADISQQPLNDQPVEDLLARYQKLASADSLPESMKRICDYKIGVLKTRVELKSQFVEAKKVQDDMQKKTMALKAEEGELQDRIKATDVQLYTAVGTLRTSSLQQGQQTLYRLTDPANGRTVIYLRSDDTKLPQFIGQFIGVKGEITDDAQQNLRFISMTAFEQVNPAKIGQSVVSQIAPPSLLPGATASSNDGTTP